MLLLFGAANRDPRHFRDPDTFDINRENLAHLTFGKGLHYRSGANLARLRRPGGTRRVAQPLAGVGPDYDSMQLAPTSTVAGRSCAPPSETADQHLSETADQHLFSRSSRDRVRVDCSYR